MNDPSPDVPPIVCDIVESTFPPRFAQAEGERCLDVLRSEYLMLAFDGYRAGRYDLPQSLLRRIVNEYVAQRREDFDED